MENEIVNAISKETYVARTKTRQHGYNTTWQTNTQKVLEST